MRDTGRSRFNCCRNPSESEVKAVIRSVERLLERLSAHIKAARPERLERPKPK
jgi:hypothetical protein